MLQQATKSLEVAVSILTLACWRNLAWYRVAAIGRF
jgi:hypothetical protein